MKAFPSIFDDGFVQDVVFSLNKPDKWGPSGSVGVLSAPVTPDSNGRCKRACVPKECECPQGDCPESECWSSQPNCECFDEFTAYAEGVSAGLGARCERGTYCLNYGDGTECTDCCQPGPGLQTCLADWKEAKREDAKNNTNNIGGWNKGNTCPEQNATALTSAPAGSCGCPRGKCTFKIYAAAPVPLDGDLIGNWFWFCYENISKTDCESEMNGLTSRRIPYVDILGRVIYAYRENWVIRERSIVSFSCCSTVVDYCPPCDRSECPTGSPTCSDSERLVHSETGEGLEDVCACSCQNEFLATTSDGKKVCVECGEKSSWDKDVGKCKCIEEYETTSGEDGYTVSEMTITSEKGHFSKTAKSPNCVSKSFRCSHVKADPFYNAYGNPMWVGGCVPVDKKDQVAGTDYFSDRSTCESAGCEIGNTTWTCVAGECTPTDVPEGQSSNNGTWNNLSDCRRECEMYECDAGSCKQRMFATPEQSISLYPSKKACNEGISGWPQCGSKWFCRNSGVGKCTQSSLENPMPAGAREFDNETQCLESCNKWFCDDFGSCAHFDGSGPQPEQSNTVLFDYEFQCNASGCGKLYCDDPANECKVAKGANAQGKSQYYENNKEGWWQCSAACT